MVLSYADRAKKNLKTRPPAAASSDGAATPAVPSTVASSAHSASSSSVHLAPTPSAISSTSSSPATAPAHSEGPTSQKSVWDVKREQLAAAKQQKQGQTIESQPSTSTSSSSSRPLLGDKTDEDDPFVVKPRHPPQRPLPQHDSWPSITKSPKEENGQQQQQQSAAASPASVRPSALPSSPLSRSQPLSPARSRSHSQYSTAGPRQGTSRATSVHSSPHPQTRDLQEQRPTHAYPHSYGAYMQAPYQPMPPYQQMYDYNQGPPYYWNTYQQFQPQPPPPPPDAAQAQQSHRQLPLGIVADAPDPQPEQIQSSTLVAVTSASAPVKLPPDESQPVSLPLSRAAQHTPEQKVVFGSLNGNSPVPSPSPQTKASSDKENVTDLTSTTHTVPQTEIKWEFGTTGKYDDSDPEDEEEEGGGEASAQPRKENPDLSTNSNRRPDPAISVPSSSLSSSASPAPSPQLQQLPSPQQPTPSPYSIPFPPNPALAPFNALGMMSPLDLTATDPSYMRPHMDQYYGYSPVPPSFEVQDYGFGFGQRSDIPPQMGYSPSQWDRDMAEAVSRGYTPPPHHSGYNQDFRPRRGSYSRGRPGRGFRGRGGAFIRGAANGGGATYRQQQQRQQQQGLPSNPYVNGGQQQQPVEMSNGFYHQPSPPFIPPQNHLPPQFAPVMQQGYGGQPLPTPLSTLSFPLDTARYYLLGQLEYYLSSQNMERDIWLRRNMNSQGYIPLHVLASFNRVKNLMGGASDVELVKNVLELSSIVEVQGEYVRMAHGQWEKYLISERERNELSNHSSSNSENQYQHQGESAADAAAVDVSHTNGGGDTSQNLQDDEDEDDVVFVMGNETS